MERTNKLSEVHSVRCTCLISGSEDGLHKMFLVTRVSLSRTYTADLHNSICARGQKILDLFVSFVYVEFCPYNFSFDDLFLLICVLQYFFLYNKKPQT